MRLPGKSVFVPSKPKITTPPPPTPVTRNDPEIDAAREDKRLAGLRRRGRKALILTSGRGVASTAPLAQPRATAAEVLG